MTIFEQTKFISEIKDFLKINNITANLKKSKKGVIEIIIKDKKSYVYYNEDNTDVLNLIKKEMNADNFKKEIMKLKKIIVAKIDDYKIYPEVYSAMKKADTILNHFKILFINIERKIK